jgi:acetolactate synthase-1/2/3 large subunit
MISGAQLVVKCLEAQGVERIFGIPGAKIDAVFNALVDSSIELIVCRHEQNAVFMAAAYGRLTGKPGVVLVTSGPGVGNMVTGLLTANTEGDPVVAIGGNVPLNMKQKASHQNADNVKIMEAVSKSSVEVGAVDNISEAIANAFQTVLAPPRGTAFISLPQDIINEQTNTPTITPTEHYQKSIAPDNLINEAATLISKAKFPILFLGQDASMPENTQAVRKLLAKTKLPTISTFQAAGVVPRELVECFAGRVGLFQNQPGDQLLAKADLVITIGFNPVEYDPDIWNKDCKQQILHIAFKRPAVYLTYQPELEVCGKLANSLERISAALPELNTQENLKRVKPYHEDLENSIAEGKNKQGDLMHPLRFIHELRESIDDDTLVICDIGSIYMWMARYFLCYEPHHLLFSNGQQTLGVALPWAISASLINPKKKIISMSGDGGFLFSATELETAVREKCNFVHFIWRDGTYNMVLEQEIMKYNRRSGVDFGHINAVEFASSFGAKGYELDDPNNFKQILKEAMQQQGPVLIQLPIDYRDNPELFAKIDPHCGN